MAAPSVHGVDVSSLAQVFVSGSIVSVSIAFIMLEPEGGLDKQPTSAVL